MCLCCTAELQEHNTKLEQDLSKTIQEHDHQTTSIKQAHQQSLTQQKGTMIKEKEQAVKKSKISM